MGDFCKEANLLAVYEEEITISLTIFAHKDVALGLVQVHLNGNIVEERVYARNNPYKYVDPDGEVAIPFAAIYAIAEAAIDIGSLAYSLNLAVKNPESDIYQVAVLLDVLDLQEGPFSNPSPSGYTYITASRKLAKDIGTSEVVRILADFEEKSKENPDLRISDYLQTILKLESGPDSSEKDILNELSELEKSKSSKRGQIRPVHGISGRKERLNKLLLRLQGRDCGEACAKATT